MTRQVMRGPSQDRGDVARGGDREEGYATAVAFFACIRLIGSNARFVTGYEACAGICGSLDLSVLVFVAHTPTTPHVMRGLSLKLCDRGGGSGLG